MWLLYCGQNLLLEWSVIYKANYFFPDHISEYFISLGVRYFLGAAGGLRWQQRRTQFRNLVSKYGVYTSHITKKMYCNFHELSFSLQSSEGLFFSVLLLEKICELYESYTKAWQDNLCVSFVLKHKLCLQKGCFRKSQTKYG